MTRETTKTPVSGALILVLELLLLATAIALILVGKNIGMKVLLLPGLLGIALVTVLAIGFFVVQPNQAAVLTFFGRYVGSVKKNGFYWVNPFTIKQKVSLRARNLNGDKLKVNDRAGNPIEIAAVIVWKVDNTAEAIFDVDDYNDYVHTQSESAVRHLAVSYPYDSSDDTLSLRGDIETVSKKLEEELSERLGRAGVTVVEARLSHLAYAPEIAGAMLRRQQADAIIAARFKIVEGAVGMVENALESLGERGIVDLDNERKAQMISNLMVVLCGQEDARPIVNAGSLY